MSKTPQFKVVDEYGVTQHIGPRSSCEKYRSNAQSLFPCSFRIIPLGA